MPQPPYKLMIFMKRRPGMSREAFLDYYENSHIPLCRKYMTGVTRYLRHYVEPLPDAATGEARELDHDVVTEVWFEERTVFDAVLAAAASDAMPEDVRRDEAQLFDRSKIRFATVIEYETVF